MDDQLSIRKQLDACHFLSLLGIVAKGSDERIFDLKVEVAELRTSPRARDLTIRSSTSKPEPAPRNANDVIRFVETHADPLEMLPGCTIFTLTFENYGAFEILNESFCLLEPNEDFSKKLRTYRQSRFLEHIATATCASDFLHEPLKHFAVICINHVVNVACRNDPLIEKRTL